MSKKSKSTFEIKILLSILCILQNSTTANTVNLKDIIKQIIEHEFHPYEILIVHYKEEQYPCVQEELLQATFTVSPTKIISFNKNNRVIQENGPKVFRSTLQRTLYLVILKDESQDNEKNRLLNFLYEQTKKFTQPRYLVIIIRNRNNSKSRESMLESAWKKFHLIHLTFIEVENKTPPHRIISKNSQRNITIHHYNPFNKKYSKQKYTKGLTIFPNTLNNLHGLRIKTATVISPLMNFEEDLDQVYLNDSTSPRAKLINFISDAMNFTILEKFKPNFNLLTQKDLVSIFSHFDLITNELPILNLYESFFSCYALHTRRSNYRILLSVQRSRGNSRSELKIPFNLGLISCSLLILIWIVLRLLRSDKKITEPLNYIGLLLGNSIEISVVKSKDRILFTSMLIGFWLFSSTFHSILTDVKFISKPNDLINSLQDLEKLNLTVYFSSDFLPLISEKRKNNTLISMFRRSRIIQNDEECIKFLVNNVPIACLLQENLAESAVSTELDENGCPRLKILSDFKLDLQTAMHFGEKSPYVFEFEKYLLKLEKMGLINKWNQDSARLERSKYKEVTVSVNQSVSMSFKLICILIVGFGLSTLVFIGEILAKRHEEEIFEIHKKAFWRFSKH